MYERCATLTEMAVYFATGNLSPKRPRSLPGNIAKEGAVWPGNCQEGTFISLGADPEIACNIDQNVCPHRKLVAWSGAAQLLWKWGR